MSTVWGTGSAVRADRSIHVAPAALISKATSIPADRTPAPAGHCVLAARPRPVSMANKPTGTEGSTNVFQSIRHQVSDSVSPTATRKMSAPLPAAGPSGYMWQPATYAALKAVALFVTAAAAFRLTQRRTIAEFTPFDWVTAVAVGAIVGRTATASSTSWLTGTAALIALILAHAAVARMRFFRWFRPLVDPPIRLLIRDGQVNAENLRRCRLTIADLEAALRQQGYENAENVRLALFEAKGAISILP